MIEKIQLLSRTSSSVKSRSCRTSGGMWVNTSELARKDNNEIVFCRHYLVTFLYSFQYALVFLHFLGYFLTLRMETGHYTATIVYRLNFLGKPHSY